MSALSLAAPLLNSKEDVPATHGIPSGMLSFIPVQMTAAGIGVAKDRTKGIGAFGSNYED